MVTEKSFAKLRMAAPAPDGQRYASGRPVPCQLPADLPFAGRSDHLKTLNTLLPDRASPRSAVVITGTAGVGKSALAIHWSRRSASQFPDGQLYVNLRGFSPDGRPVEPDGALRTFLDALHVRADDMPSELQARIGLYRSLLADRRMLVLLDNARDAEQVRPLLPAADGCLAVVTSRDPMNGLAVTDGAHLLQLDLLDHDEAREVLTQRIGEQRVDAEPDAAQAIIDECSGLPLALAIAAARVCGHRNPSLAYLADELRSARGTLEAFSGRDRASDLRAIFSLSYRALSADAARVFRLFQLQVGESVSTAALAAAAAFPLAEARRLLDVLVDANLVREHEPARYTTHDLLRAYAGELVGDGDCASESDAAVRRLLDYHLHSAYAADRQIYPHRLAISPDEPTEETARERFIDDGAATAWFAKEITTLLDAVELAASRGLDLHTWHLAWCLTTYLNRAGRWHEWFHVQTIALAAADRLGDLARRAYSHRDLAQSAIRLRRYEQARVQMRQALSLYEQAGDVIEQARCHGGMAWGEEQAGRFAEALAHAQAKLMLIPFGEDAAQTGSALNTVGWYHALLGDHEPALRLCRQGLQYFQTAGDLHGEAYTWESLGYIEQHLRNYQTAIEHYRRALTLCDKIGERYLGAKVSARLGEAYHAVGDADGARRAWRAALDTFDEIDSREAAATRATMAHQGHPLTS
ncbi:tetratricopeptide repeat protein [Virgisporangium aurantiacum]|uniref:NB-ARC domain-containing protein n=1 Tax=Virgisporangium aurantiacum TaxID=175570 RepID=A0A8J3ZHL2_9ACTN|nr:tetratricopeptide repeat protein [Virgisporangium aurantiacum]GIJ63976.1 hypothetical protein Vau01_114920 [Virgisporangium aurantiacum]